MIKISNAKFLIEYLIQFTDWFPGHIMSISIIYYFISQQSIHFEGATPLPPSVTHGLESPRFYSVIYQSTTCGGTRRKITFIFSLLRLTSWCIESCLVFGIFLSCVMNLIIKSGTCNICNTFDEKWNYKIHAIYIIARCYSNSNFLFFNF